MIRMFLLALPALALVWCVVVTVLLLRIWGKVKHLPG
jgi:hypothetical protein